MCTIYGVIFSSINDKRVQVIHLSYSYCQILYTPFTFETKRKLTELFGSQTLSCLLAIKANKFNNFTNKLFASFAAVPRLSEVKLELYGCRGLFRNLQHGCPQKTLI